MLPLVKSRFTRKRDNHGREVATSPLPFAFRGEVFDKMAISILHNEGRQSCWPWLLTASDPGESVIH